MRMLFSPSPLSDVVQFRFSFGTGKTKRRSNEPTHPSALPVVVIYLLLLSLSPFPENTKFVSRELSELPDSRSVGRLIVSAMTGERGKR